MCKTVSIKHISVAILALISIGAVLAWSCLNSPSNTRYAVFAGYNTDGIIPPYVINYLKGLNEVSDGVVYIADSPLAENEARKLQGLVLHTEHKRHNEYDWGSYKRGFNWLKENGYLEKADEVIFANDSCYAPMQSFKPMFQDMAKHPEFDFWGNSKNITFNPHLQSYFMVFRKPVLHSKIFASFLNQVTTQEHYEEYIIKYELKLTPLLANLGYTWGTWLPYEKLPLYEKDYTDVNNYPLLMIRDYKNQFLKRRTFTTMLTILDDRAELLRYIKQHYPARYTEIAGEISPHFIPDDLKEKTYAH